MYKHLVKRITCTTLTSDIEGLAKKVAEDFKQTMLAEGFDSFSEMSQCYMWDSQDIKEEIYYMVHQLYGKDCHVTDGVILSLE